ncbi:MAG: DNA topoisomerase VI subunit B [Thermoplasmatota archaeon]
MPAKPIAEELAKKQREISVSEFFERNKHILGFDSAIRSLITCVKEAVDNALDACEEAGILPDLNVEIRRDAETEYTMIVEDNGPGIVKKQLPNIFGKLLYGSRFHAIRQTRGAQGIGISAAVMYGQLTTGKAAIIESKIGDGHPVVRIHLRLDTKNNRPDVVREEIDHWDKPHGTRVSISMTAKYQRGAQSVFEYLRSTAIVNPHARISLKEPDGTVTIFERATDQLPIPTKEIKPHPEGIELGMLLKMAKNTEARKVASFLQTEFSRVSAEKAREVCESAAKRLPVDHALHGDGEALADLKPSDVDAAEAKALMEAFLQVKLMAPPTDCLSPIGEVLIRKGLKKELQDAEFIATVTRPPAVYSGRPFQVEAGVVYGGSLPRDEPVRIIRFANRVPLMYQKGACASTVSVEEVDWRRYELEQRAGKGVPIGPAVILVHVASVNVPFTSEAKEAIADVDPIRNEMLLALRECGRKLGGHLRKRAKLTRMKEKEGLIRKLLPKIAEKSASIVGKPVPDVEPVIAQIMNNVMVNDQIAYDAKSRSHSVTVTVTNYTQTAKSFDLMLAVPHGVPLKDIMPKPTAQEDGLITWKVSRLPSVKKAEHAFTLVGLDETDYDETESYIRGLDEEIVAGADVWKGKTEQEPAERIVTILADGQRFEGVPTPASAEVTVGDGADQDGDVPGKDRATASGASSNAPLGDLAAQDRRKTTGKKGASGKEGAMSKSAEKGTKATPSKRKSGGDR